MSDRNEILAEMIGNMEDYIAKVEALPDEGSILFIENIGMAINFKPDGEAFIGNLIGARVFSDEERGLGRGKIAPELRQQYGNVAGDRAMLFALPVAKAKVLKMQREGLAFMRSKMGE